MLIESIRKHSESWWFRAFLSILAITFGVLWYGQDVLTGARGGVSNLASVGGIKINVHQFSQVLSQELSRLQHIMKDTIPPEQQKKIYPYVLENMVNNLLLQREAARMGLVVTDDRIRRTITQDQNFKKADGSFDREKFNAFLQNSGMQEKTFVETLRQDLLIRDLTQTLFGSITAPQSLTSRLYSYENQRRLLNVAIIESAKLTLDKEPSNAEILDYFKKNPAKFVASEYRDVSAIVLTSAILKQKIDITQDQLQQAYQTRADEFRGKTFDQVEDKLKADLEKRTAGENLFDLTNKIDDAMAGGATLEEVAKTYGLQVKTFSRIGKDGVYDPGNASKELDDHPRSLENPLEIRIISEAFQEKEGDSTKIIETGDGTFFVARIDKIYPAHPLTFKESQGKAKNLLIQDLKSEKAKEIALNIENQVNHGGLFAMVAQEKGLRVSQIRVSRKGALGPIALYLPDHFIEALYHVGTGSVKAVSYLNDHNQPDFIVGNVAEIEPVEIRGAEDRIKAFKEQLQREIFHDLLAEYLYSLHRIFPVEYNNKALQNLLRQAS